MKLLITIDTEGDNSWLRGQEVTTKNAKYLPRFQTLCEKYNYKPTYLTAYEMAMDDYFVEFGCDASERGMCEIGLHPHAWTSPPIVPLTSDDMLYHPYLIEFSEGIIREKVKVLTALLQERFATKMYSHRAGRWAFNATYARILCEFGYKVDCSVTPHVAWHTNRRPGNDPQMKVFDYSGFRTEPYFLSGTDISKEGDLPLLEIPVTIIPRYGELLRWVHSHLPRRLCQGAIQRVFGPPFSWFRPHSIYHELVRVAQAKISEGADYIMFTLHSSELMPGGSQRFGGDKEIEQLYEDIEEAFSFLRDHKVTAATCYEYHNIVQESLTR